MLENQLGYLQVSASPVTTEVCPQPPLGCMLLYLLMETYQSHRKCLTYNYIILKTEKDSSANTNYEDFVNMDGHDQIFAMLRILHNKNSNENIFKF